MLPLKPATISGQTQRLVSVALSLSGRIMLWKRCWQSR